MSFEPITTQLRSVLFFQMKILLPWSELLACSWKSHYGRCSDYIIAVFSNLPFSFFFWTFKTVPCYVLFVVKPLMEFWQKLILILDNTHFMIIYKQLTMSERLPDYSLNSLHLGGSMIKWSIVKWQEVFSMVISHLTVTQGKKGKFHFGWHLLSQDAGESNASSYTRFQIFALF